MSRILVTGSSNGLGLALANALRYEGHVVYEYDIVNGQDVRVPRVSHLEELDVLINCAGINLINWLDCVSEADWNAVMDINAKGIFLMSQACLPMLIESNGTILNIVSNAAHMPMQTSLAYNASKGAALMMTRQLARELGKRYGITVFSVSPNKLRGTGMSNDIDEQVMRTRGWSKEKAQEYQISSLLAGEETDPKVLAEFIAFLLAYKRRHKYLAGCDLQYGL